MFHSHPPRNYSQSLLCLNIVLSVLIMFIVRLKGSGVAGISAVCSSEGFSNSVRRIVYGDTDHPFASPYLPREKSPKSEPLHITKSPSLLQWGLAWIVGCFGFFVGVLS